jgi:hypothetical protein
MANEITTPTEHIIVTENTDKIRGDLHAAYDGKGLELVNSSPTSIVWRWYNAPSDALTTIAAIAGYKGTV